MLRIAIQKITLQTIRTSLLIIITTMGYSIGIDGSTDSTSLINQNELLSQRNAAASSIILQDQKFRETTILPSDEQNIIYKSYDISNDGKILVSGLLVSSTVKPPAPPSPTTTTTTAMSPLTSRTSTETTTTQNAEHLPNTNNKALLQKPSSLTTTSGISSTATTTVRTYLGMHNNITNSKLSVPVSSSRMHAHGHTHSHQTDSASSSSSSSSSSSGSGGGAKNIKLLALPKPQKTDAPMLNYIFDSFSTANKHHHHDQRYGPHFEDIRREGNITNITVQAGSTVQLNCRISLLQDKTVSWVKRNSNGAEEALELLTVGVHTYSGDNRFTMEFQYPSNWRLKISNARKSDEGTYECQISTHPPRVIQINLHVNAPKVMIVDEYGTPMQEKYYETDSTLQLSCIVRNVVMSSSVVYWSHGDQTLNYDLTRGGVSVKTELMEDGANSTLFIARINKSDSGNYTCSINSSHEYNITVHILNGESFAELHHGNSLRSTTTTTLLTLYIPVLIVAVYHRTQIVSLILR